MPTIDIESDPLFQLLTDALRAGPGSALWAQAVAKVRESAEANGHRDEYAMLLAAREHLEGGKEYKSVRPGAGFTRKVMAEIEKDEASGSKRGLPTATLVAGLSILAVLGIIALIVGLVLREPSTVDNNRNDARALANAIFTESAAVAKFGDTPAPAGWKTIGQLPLKAISGQLQPILPAGDKVDSMGGGIVLATPVPAAQAVAIEANVTLPPNADSGWITQVFIGDEALFDPRSGTSLDEVAWDAGGSTGEVIRIGGETAVAPSQIPPMKSGEHGRTVAIRIDAKSVSIFIDHQQVWIGANHLSDDKPRFAGVRFIWPGGKPQTACPAVQSIEVKTLAAAGPGR